MQTTVALVTAPALQLAGPLSFCKLNNIVLSHLSPFFPMSWALLKLSASFCGVISHVLHLLTPCGTQPVSTGTRRFLDFYSESGRDGREAWYVSTAKVLAEYVTTLFSNLSAVSPLGVAH